MKCKCLWRVFLPLLLLTISLQAESFTGKVIGVTDGDTIEVLHDGTSLKIRLYGVDCPESGQDFGSRAKQLTSGLCFNEKVQVDVKELDRYGRSVAVVTLPDGKVLNEELVRRGLAWWYEHYAPDNTTLKELQEAARSKQIGLWSIPNPAPPWDFRNGERATATAFTSSATSINAAYLSNSKLYVTRTGSKVHVDGCRYLSKSQIPITAEHADAQGYTACSVCNPNFPSASDVCNLQAHAAQNDERISAAPTTPISDYTIYVTRTGHKYHSDGCRYLSKSRIPISLSQAQSRGYGPCSVCNP